MDAEMKAVNRDCSTRCNKDNIDTADKMQTTAGSLAQGNFASKDAFVVERLRDAGAIIIENKPE
jgi:Asp-tRNA(Asn)/Glu-tRNA(Gln) amidotransferase A subunit family amidase